MQWQQKKTTNNNLQDITRKIKIMRNYLCIAILQWLSLYVGHENKAKHRSINDATI